MEARDRAEDHDLRAEPGDGLELALQVCPALADQGRCHHTRWQQGQGRTPDPLGTVASGHGPDALYQGFGGKFTTNSRPPRRSALWHGIGAWIFIRHRPLLHP